MGLLGAIFVLVGWFFGGQGGIVIALGFAILTNVGMFWFSDKLALKMAGARPVSAQEEPELHAMVEELARKAGIPKPAVYMIDTWQPNAFATGRSPKHASVAVTKGIMQMLDRNELRAVMAHELGHVANRDMLVATIAAVFAGAISMVANLALWTTAFGGGDDDNGNPLSLIGTLLMVFLAPIAATIVQLAISRSREFGADSYGGKLSRNPLALASALQKIEAGAKRIRYEPNQGTAALFIQNPLHGGFSGLFSTHPRTIDRVNRLRQMAGVAPLMER
jgi:heat shock protein HtpX